ncbi:acetylornithine transaminase [Natronoglycomyces albus]|uniref:Acetylornithine transaminase n=1 Tax=Natronoglycomyces albus TaxID=2811108 RepID=A0A895XFK9_9ACTN|nr:acetylornithine transaminase [Natronoglycomyces albus]QSB04114.1 acetylornithine transaminase [Natronoglycomyces albus]
MSYTSAALSGEGIGNQWHQRQSTALMGNYGHPRLTLESGHGRYVTDVHGKSYLDMIGGIAVSALGHNHPAITAAVCDQVRHLAHTSNLYAHPTGIRLAEQLLDIAGVVGKVFLCNSGTEANEAALKIALLAGASDNRRRIVAAESGFHGRTLGALALTGKSDIRQPFAPFGIEVTFVPYGDAAALKEALGEDVAAVFLEPTQGEAGVVVPPKGYLAEARTACTKAGAALVCDEIQSGIGRTGRWFAHHSDKITPDLITVAKGLGGGLPIGACIGVGPYADVLVKGSHGSTFGGNPVACAAALAVINTIAHDDLLSHVTAMGEHLLSALKGHPAVAEVRGHGLWRGIGLHTTNAAEVCQRLEKHGVLANPVRPDTIRIAPPLTITQAEVDLFCAALATSLAEATSSQASPAGGNHLAQGASE